ncbi:MAG: PnuC protein [Acidobacteriota bacterium]|nr:PnuC protein [Acidobacteriota bacterium]MDH3529012.1 PnuC protein [Acidobacteriota bacterium]
MQIFQYYGIDWLATACGLSGVYLLGNQNKFGFVVFMVASMSWIIFGAITGSYAVIIGSCIFLVLHARGLYKWIRQEEAQV